MVDMIDENVGQVLEYLESTQEFDTTFVLLCQITEQRAQL